MINANGMTLGARIIRVEGDYSNRYWGKVFFFFFFEHTILFFLVRFSVCNVHAIETAANEMQTIKSIAKLHIFHPNQKW